MKTFGLIGKTLHYSFSKNYFTEKFLKEGIKNCSYHLFELETIEKFCSFLDKQELHGLNVTIPYKESIIPYLEELDPEAAKIGAVNTIKFEDGYLKGYNTDVIGFRDSLLHKLNGRKIEHALILGTGGASKAIQFALEKLAIQSTIVSRSKGDIHYKELDEMCLESHQLIINCTPLGTFPSVDECPPIPYQYLTAKHLLYDLVYNPEKSLFLKRGEASNAEIINGLPMLIGQAEASWKIWNN